MLLAVLGLMLGGASVHGDLGGTTGGGVDVADGEGSGEHQAATNEGSGIHGIATSRAAVIEGRGGLGGVTLDGSASEHFAWG